MWLITKFGFFSIVQKPGDAEAGMLTVRARVRADLEALRAAYLPEMGEITENAGTDYRYRACVPHEALAAALQQIVLDIDYGNFKNAVQETQGPKRSHLYHQVWDVLYHLQDVGAEPKPASTIPKATSASSARKKSFGGVLFDDCDRVLLRRPANDWDGYAWTFAKGRMEKGGTPEGTALREVFEETGYRAVIVGEVPGAFAGSASTNRYYLMVPSSAPEPFDPRETEEVRWVSHEKAVGLIKQTRNQTGMERDLAVLEAAFEEWNCRSVARTQMKSP
jgi:8-oxo-dGTP pyrophosphatase MutT (NUDIX family)